MSLLRSAAHVRHAIWSAAFWGWCPPAYLLSRAIHAEIVDGLYDQLEGRRDESGERERC